jgi:ribulose-bisphosphate carboxylase large chain
MANRNICDFKPDSEGTFVSDGDRDGTVEQSSGNLSAQYRFGRSTFTWEGITPEVYQGSSAGAAGLVRNIIVGSHGESTPFELRYFEMGPGCSSESARHPLEHVVIGVRGKGKAVVGERTIDLNPLDVLYIAPDDIHQISNREEQPFGFFCIVSAERESMAELLQDELDWLQEAAQGRGGVRR